MVGKVKKCTHTIFIYYLKYKKHSLDKETGQNESMNGTYCINIANKSFENKKVSMCTDC